jgi:hypothetical protein
MDEEESVKEFVVPVKIICRVLELTEVRSHRPSKEFESKVKSGECTRTVERVEHDEL